jgi:hypothetical protein
MMKDYRLRQNQGVISADSACGVIDVINFFRENFKSKITGIRKKY